LFVTNEHLHPNSMALPNYNIDFNLANSHLQYVEFKWSF
jgi:hypothetical protein